MREYHIHFANIDLKGDIPCYKFYDWSEVVGFTLTESEVGVVYLFSVFDEVFITPNIASGVQFIEYQIKLYGLRISSHKIDIFIQEYKSIEESYKVGFSMFDGIHPLCYEN